MTQSHTREGCPSSCGIPGTPASLCHIMAGDDCGQQSTRARRVSGGPHREHLVTIRTQCPDPPSVRHTRSNVEGLALLSASQGHGGRRGRQAPCVENRHGQEPPVSNRAPCLGGPEALGNTSPLGCLQGPFGRLADRKADRRGAGPKVQSLWRRPRAPVPPVWADPHHGEQAFVLRRTSKSFSAPSDGSSSFSV